MNCLPITNLEIVDKKPLGGFMLSQPKGYQEFLRTQWLIVKCLLEMAVTGWDIWIRSIESYHKAPYFKKE